MNLSNDNLNDKYFSEFKQSNNYHLKKIDETKENLNEAFNLNNSETIIDGDSEYGDNEVI